MISSEHVFNNIDNSEIERLKAELAELRKELDAKAFEISPEMVHSRNDQLHDRNGILRRQNDYLAALVEEQRQRLNDLCPLIEAASQAATTWNAFNLEMLLKALEGIKPYDGLDHAEAITNMMQPDWVLMEKLCVDLWLALTPRQRDQFLRERK